MAVVGRFLRCLSVLGFVLLALGPPIAAWGPDGHRIVCRMAYDLLTPPTLQAVDGIIEDDRRFVGFVESCNWPDQVRETTEFAEERRRHYMNVEPGSSIVEPSRDCPGRCVLEGIRFHGQRLETVSTPGSRAEALAFLAHYVGDVHQPLHVAFRRDLGGNKVRIAYCGGSAACGKPECDDCPDYNLHRLWDSVLIAEGDEDWRLRADRLRRDIDAGERHSWAAAPSVDWANESYRIAVEQVYPTAADAEISQEEFETLISVVERRLQQAGTRLAASLERRLGQGARRETAAGDE